jgi:RNA polymerase sigma-70 factor (ECF subfamily)
VNRLVLQERINLVEGARRRDVAAFEELVAIHRAHVYGLAMRMMQNASDAEDVTQETFLSAWQNLPNFRGEAGFGSWLFRICANFCLMRFRRAKREAAEAEVQLPGPRFDSEGTLLSAPSYDWTRGTEDKALDKELRRAIESATASLPADYRTVFLLKDIEGLSNEEISQLVDATIPAIKSRLHRARLALREAIDAFYRQPCEREVRAA